MKSKDYLNLFINENPNNIDEILKKLALLSLEGDIKLMDEILEITDPVVTKPIICVALLRYSFRFKDKLNNWIIFRDKTKSYLIECSLDPSKLMRGL